MHNHPLVWDSRAWRGCKFTVRMNDRVSGSVILSLLPHSGTFGPINDMGYNGIIVIKITLTLIGMHLFGSAILFGYISGPGAILATPILCLFGWFFIFPEAIGMALIWKLYEPHRNQGWLRTIKYALVFSVSGAIVVATFIPKEENNELQFWIGGLFAGLGAATFSFVCIHRIKMSITNRTEQTIRR